VKNGTSFKKNNEESWNFCLPAFILYMCRRNLCLVDDLGKNCSRLKKANFHRDKRWAWKIFFLRGETQGRKTKGLSL
jgi:hypothetical protein